VKPASADLVFGALADRNRRAIVELIAERGPATPTELSAELAITRQGASKHLASLVEAGILDPARRGREVRYALVREGLEPGSAWLEGVGDQWDRRLGALKRHVGGRP
jgi:DNA-binding transcriptional ArsR family regulator